MEQEELIVELDEEQEDATYFEDPNHPANLPPDDEELDPLDQIITYDVNRAAIAMLAKQYADLRVMSPDDEEGYELVKGARNEVRSYRLRVEERRKELKAESLRFGRLVDGKAKELFALIEPIEFRLVEQLRIVDDEKKRRKEEAERKLKERTERRLRELNEVRAPIDMTFVATASEEDYDDYYTQQRVAFLAAEKERQEREQRLAQLEKEREEQAAKIRALEEAEAKRQQEAETQRKLDEQKAQLERQHREREEAERERAALKAEMDRREAKAREELARKEAEEKAHHEAWAAEQVRVADEIRLKREAEERAAAEIADRQAFEDIKVSFPTLERCWVEIHRLRKELMAAMEPSEVMGVY